MHRARLTEKQARFVEEYLVDLNATAAAIRAGYGNRGDYGRQVFRKAPVQAALQEAFATRSQRTEIKQDRVLNEYAMLGFSDIGDVLDFTNGTLRLKKPAEIPVAARRAIQSIKIKRTVKGTGEQACEIQLIELKFWSKTDALAKLAQHLGMFDERHEQAGTLDPILRALYQHAQAPNARPDAVIEARVNEEPLRG